jgi:hypothetical protein
MVLIDSPIDLMATASRDQPVQAGVRPTILDTTGYDPWRDIYLQGVYEKRVQQLEQFAKEKSFDYEVIKTLKKLFFILPSSQFSSPRCLYNKLGFQ